MSGNVSAKSRKLIEVFIPLKEINEDALFEQSFKPSYRKLSEN